MRGKLVVDNGEVFFCNICQSRTTLTRDHIPPKGGPQGRNVTIARFLQARTAAGQAQHLRHVSQSGLMYRTICGRCNSRLGRFDDRALNDFANRVARYVRAQQNSRLWLPEAVTFKGKPTRIMRAILGHALAAKVLTSNDDLTVLTRQTLMDDCAGIPEPVEVFYWVYPYSTVCIVPEVGMLKQPGAGYSPDNFGFFGIIKYFPIGYLVTTDVRRYADLDRMSAFRTCGIDDLVDIPVRMRRDKPYRPTWPDDDHDGNCLLFGANLVLHDS